MQPKLNISLAAKVLNEEGRIIAKQQNTAIRSQLRRRTGNLLQNRSYQVTAGSNTATLSLTHPAYERYLEIIPRISQNTRSFRKRKYHIHNKIIFGRLNSIARKLSYGYADEIIKEMKTSIPTTI